MGIAQSIERQASLYVFDLHNFAREHGCQTDENWQLKQATLDEKKDLERSYQLTMSGKYLPEEIAELLKFVKLRLNTVSPVKEPEPDVSNKDGQYLIAFHTGKLKR